MGLLGGCLENNNMKSFLKFISEAQSNAAKQAKKLGLRGDGHGSWLDSNERVVGRTVEGELVFTSGRKPAQETDPTKPGRAARQTVSDVPPPAASAAGAATPEESEEELPVEKTRGTVTLGFGRFNPPTSGHEKLLDHIKKTAAGEQYMIYPSHSVDPQKNPIDAETKVLFMKKMFPDHSTNIIYDPSIRTIIDALKHADVQGYSSVNIVVGADRQKEFESLANKYNGQLYNFDAINVVSAGERDPDAEGVEGMSASKLRALAADGDFETFRQGLPKGARGMVARELFNTVQRSMGAAATKKEGLELWQIAPKFDWKNLREHYISGAIFNIGQLVENMNTGLIGRVMRKGTNYVIAVTKEGIMFKSWIQDLNEYIRRPVSGVVESKREIGTDSYREYVQSLTPQEKVHSFINNIKK